MRHSIWYVVASACLALTADAVASASVESSSAPQIESLERLLGLRPSSQIELTLARSGNSDALTQSAGLALRSYFEIAPSDGLERYVIWGLGVSGVRSSVAESNPTERTALVWIGSDPYRPWTANIRMALTQADQGATELADFEGRLSWWPDGSSVEMSIVVGHSRLNFSHEPTALVSLFSSRRPTLASNRLGGALRWDLSRKLSVDLSHDRTWTPAELSQFSRQSIELVTDESAVDIASGMARSRSGAGLNWIIDDRGRWRWSSTLGLWASELALDGSQIRGGDFGVTADIRRRWRVTARGGLSRLLPSAVDSSGGSASSASSDTPSVPSFEFGLSYSW